MFMIVEFFDFNIVYDSFVNMSTVNPKFIDFEELGAFNQMFSIKLEAGSIPPLRLNKKFQVIELRYDDLFKDLFYIDSLDSETYFSEYLKQKLIKMGMHPDDLLQIFPKNRKSSDLNFEPEVDKSNLLKHKGKILNVAEMTLAEKVSLIPQLTYEQLNKYNNLECIRAENYISTPARKLQYPEPFIASASFIHTDIGFIHILQYQF